MHLSNCLVLFALIILSSKASFGQTNNVHWKKVKDKEGIVIYERDSALCNIKIYNGHMILEADMHDIEKFVKNIKNYPQWMTSIDSAEYIEVFSDSVFIYRIVLQIPVLKNMEAIARFEFSRDERDTFVKTQSTSVPDYLVPNPLYKRLEVFSTSWQIKKLSNGYVKVTYNGMVDTYNNFISLLIGRTIISNIFESFNGLRKYGIN